MKDLILQGLKNCSLDKDVPPNCKECTYSFNGQKCENNRTGKRCCDELKDDLISLFEWHKMDWENPSELKDHHYYLITHEMYKTPMKAKWHDEMGGCFEVMISGPLNNEFWYSWDFDNPIIAWMEMLDIYREEEENEPR